MTPARLLVLAFVLSLPFAIVIAGPAAKRKVRVTHYGYPGDAQATSNTRLGLGDHNNILNKDSVAVSPDLDSIFSFGSSVSIDGHFLGFRHDTTNPKLRNTIAVYDPNGKGTLMLTSMCRRG